MNIALVFKLLADETRIRLLLLLKEHELTVAELSNTLQLAQPRISTHLAKLKEHRFVLGRKDGVSTYYRINKSVVSQQYKSLWESLMAEVRTRNPSKSAHSRVGGNPVSSLFW